MDTREFSVGEMVWDYSWYLASPRKATITQVLPDGDRTTLVLEYEDGTGETTTSSENVLKEGEI